MCFQAFLFFYLGAISVFGSHSFAYGRWAEPKRHMQKELRLHRGAYACSDLMSKSQKQNSNKLPVDFNKAQMHKFFLFWS